MTRKNIIKPCKFPPDLKPLRLPTGWSVMQVLYDGISYKHSGNWTIVLATVIENEQRLWLHGSIAHPTRFPTYQNLKLLKKYFIGEDRTAIQVFPPASRHINIHQNCLHLFSCVNEQVIPDFTDGLDTL